MHAKVLSSLSQNLLQINLMLLTHLIVGSVTAEILIAQTVNPVPVPSPVTPIPPPLPTSPLLPPPENLLQIPPPTPIPSQDLENAPGTITVERFEFAGSTIFSPEQLAEVTAQFTKKPITFPELLAAPGAVTKLYTDQGYVTSGAFIPANQSFTEQGSVVKIQIVEGSLEDIKVTGKGRLNPNYVQNRLALAAEQPLNVNRLLEALQLLQLNPLIKNISAELQAGSSPGKSFLVVQFATSQTFRPQISLDNSRPPSIGTFQRQIQLNEGNLLGQGDGLSVAYANTDGSNNIDASYAFPLNPRNGTLQLNYGTTSSNVIEPPFNRLDIKADSRYYDLTLRQPLVQTPTQELALGLTTSRRESDTELLGIPFPLSPGADDKGRTRISAVRFFQELTQRSSREVFAARSQFSLGVGALDATVNETAPDSRFFAWRGQAQYVRLLAADTLFLVRTDIQLATRALVPLEQFSLGGIESVRGYRQDLLLTDNGTNFSAELRYPILRAPKLRGVLQLTPFVDFGTVWNSSGRAAPDPNTLVSVGLGLRWQQGDNLTARFDWGIPLVSISDTDRTLQENGLYFSVIYTPF